MEHTEVPKTGAADTLADGITTTLEALAVDTADGAAEAVFEGAAETVGQVIGGWQPSLNSS